MKIAVITGEESGDKLAASAIKELKLQYKENIYVLDSPILSNSQFLKFNNFFKKKIKHIDCTFKNDENLNI